MKTHRVSARSCVAAAALAALAAAAPAAHAQSNAEVLKELQALKDRVAELEAKLKAAEAAKPAAPAQAQAQWGMTPEQTAEFNRVAVKTEALEDAMEASGLKGLKISGYIDPTYIYNRDQHRAGFQFLNSVADDGFNYDNSYFGSAVIDFQKQTESGTRWRLTLAPQRGVGAVVDGKNIVQEASVSMALSDDRTRLIAGQIPDWSGYEYQPATQNKLITHNLLFDFTLPVAYTGAGVELTRGKWITKAVLANMNGTKRQPNERTPVIAYRVDYSKGEYQGFGFAGVNGKASNFRGSVDKLAANPVTGEPYSTRDTWLNLFEADAYFIRGDWTLQGQLSFGQQRNAAITADPVTGELRNARWYGASALAAYKLIPQLEGIVRADFISNKKNGGGLLGFSAADSRNGIGPGSVFDADTASWAPADPDSGSNRMAVSFGLNYLFNLNTTFRAEYRLDRASEAVFVDVTTGDYKKLNHLLGASVLVSF